MAKKGRGNGSGKARGGLPLKLDKIVRDVSDGRPVREVLEDLDSYRGRVRGDPEARSILQLTGNLLRKGQVQVERWPNVFPSMLFNRLLGHPYKGAPLDAVRFVRLTGIEPHKSGLCLRHALEPVYQGPHLGPRHNGKITALAALSGDLVLSASRDRTVRLWNLLTGKNQLLVPRQAEEVSAMVAVTADLVMAVRSSGIPELWHLQRNNRGEVQLSSIDTGTPVKSVTALCSIGNGDLILGDKSGALIHWNPRLITPLRLGGGHRAAVATCIVLPQTRQILSGGEDGLLLLQEPAARGAIHILQNFQNAIRGLTADGLGVLYVTTKDNLFALDQNGEIQAKKRISSPVRAITPCSNIGILTSHQDHSLRHFLPPCLETVVVAAGQSAFGPVLTVGDAVVLGDDVGNIWILDAQKGCIAPAPTPGPTSTTPAPPVKLFVSYSHRDDVAFSRVVKVAIALLENDGLVSESWTDHKIKPGEVWEEKLWKELESSDVVVLMTSMTSLTSDFCRRERDRALEMHESGQATVANIVISKCPWKKKLGHIQSLPMSTAAHPEVKPVNKWRDRNDASYAVYKGLKDLIIERMKMKR